MNTRRICPACRQSKPASEYYRTVSSCKDCHKERSKEQYARAKLAAADLRTAEELLAELVDPSECSLDHTGTCQEHWGGSADEPCPHAAAKQWLAARGRTDQENS